MEFGDVELNPNNPFLLFFQASGTEEVPDDIKLMGFAQLSIS